MATVAFFHAHPDDEAISTGGTMARLADAGHRVVLVCATDGSRGEAVAGSVPAGSTLAAVRAAELDAAAGVLGVDRAERLGYRDSGMAGAETNDDPDCFWQADPASAAARLAGLLAGLEVDLLTVYDANGGYGHPDHIQVHRVGHRAAARVGIPAVEAVMNRDHLLAVMEAALEAGVADIDEEAMAERRRAAEEGRFGVPATAITHAVDVTGVLERKRAALACHRSQIGDDSFFLRLPPEAFAASFGTEWFVDRRRRGGPPYSADLLDVLDVAGTGGGAR
ncbi:MAG: GlcNAc-PI de-N-acetylase [Actinomyces sp.]|nr:MAG: GlcNAc-PI de-N-acetylase [Actinomyces sp.]